MKSDMAQQRYGSAIALLFGPALIGIGIGLLDPVTTPLERAGQLVRLALVLLGLDQARMAWVDLVRVRQAQTTPDPRLTRFKGVTISTVIWELIGFYGAVQEPVIGMMIVFSSQLWFHCLAPVQLIPHSSGGILVQPYTVPQRLPVLIADGVLLGLLGLIGGAIAPLGNAIAVLVLILAYLGHKIISPSTPLES